MKKGIGKNLLYTLAAVAFLIAFWAVAWAAVGNELLVPSFSDTVKEFFALWTDGAFWVGFLRTLLRVLVAFVLSFVSAVGLAVISYLLPPFGRFFAPIVAVLRSMPVLAVLLILIVWTSAGVAPVWVAFFSLFPMLYAGTLSALAGVDKDLIEMSRAFKVPVKRRVSGLYLPAVTPYMIRESGAGLGFAVKLVVSAEVLVRTKNSLGGLIQNAQLYTEMPTLFALVVVACVAGFAFDCLGTAIGNAVERRLQ
ncbi:MAG: ABC transporter permease subunit [Clostridia bacterium]|nr:ABC transporter permease subunit [Clostridia bacterium]